MNRHIIKFFSFLALISFSSLTFSTFAFAENSCGDASTNLIDCDVGGTGMIYTVVNTIINILTASVGVIATIGIIWCGFLILTAKDDQSRVATAKNAYLKFSSASPFGAYFGFCSNSLFQAALFLPHLLLA